MIKWANAELDIVKENYPKFRYISEFMHLLPNRTIRGVEDRVKMEGIKRSDAIKLQIRKELSERLTKLNKTVYGRDMNYEFAKNEVLKYKSKQQMHKYDASLYQYIRKNNLWDELCEHLVVGASFNYPQTFLYYCIKKLYPNNKVIMNDRKAIYPKEIDVYIPDLMIGFEYDGATYHKDVNLDIKKNNLCKLMGINLMRIDEKSKLHPENVIIESLSKFGYNINLLNKHELIKESFSKQYTVNEIKDITSKFEKLKDFQKEYNNLYSFLKRKNLLQEYTSHLSKPYEITIDKILEFFSKCKYKSDVFNDAYGKKLYAKFKKCFKNNLEIITAYSKLKFRKSSRKRIDIKYYYSFNRIDWILFEIPNESCLKDEAIKKGWSCITIYNMIKYNKTSTRGNLKNIYFKREYL